MSRLFRVRVSRSTAWLVLIAGCLLMLSACAPKTIPPPPGFPSEVFTRAGSAFNVRGLRMAGTFQDWRLKQGDSMFWVPYDQVGGVRFTGPVEGSYRPAQIFLTEGDQINGKLYVDFLLEGTTDVGYWVMPMREVDRLSIGTE